MKTPLRHISTFVILLSSCSNIETSKNHTSKPTPDDTLKKSLSQTTIQSNIPDTIKLFVVDDYPITNEMFGKDINQNAREIKRGDVRSLDQVWFTNKALNQTLVFELHTDNFRMTTFHFQNSDIPRELIRSMELVTNDGEVASDQQKEKYFKEFLGSSRIISQKYFTTNKGFRLGDKKQKALSFYGKPDEITKSNSLEIDKWNFVGENLYDEKIGLNVKPLAKDNFGHQATMFFRNNHLIAMIFHNDIP